MPSARPAHPGFTAPNEQREEIRAVLEADHTLAIAFQPIVDLRTGQVAGYEALARFDDPQRRPPNAWFAQAHRCGLGYELPRSPATPLRHLPHSQPQLVRAQLDGGRARAPRPARRPRDRNHRERGPLRRPETMAALAAIRRRGARLAIDDTGSGYAGLTSVMRLAPDVIKLDRALTAGVADDPVKAALIGSFVRYAREIDAHICAEGIEDLRDLACLADLDVASVRSGLGRRFDA